MMRTVLCLCKGKSELRKKYHFPSVTSFEDQTSSEKLALFARVSDLSIKNAERWIEDAKLLMGNSSFGHASALLRIAYEEVAKALVCWYVSETMVPVESIFLREVFQKHVAKNQVILGLLLGVAWMSKDSSEMIKIKEISKEKSELTGEEVFEACAHALKEITAGMEKMKQRGIYVDLDLKNKKVMTPKEIGEKQVKGILEGVEAVLGIVKYGKETLSASEKEIIKKFFSSIPKEAWKTGEIPITWFKKRIDEL